MTSTSASFKYLTIEKHPSNIYIVTLRKGAENRLNAPFCEEIRRAFHSINRELGSASEGAVITRGNNEKFWCTGVELEDPDPWSSSDGFYPMLATIMDFPFPTIAMITGHTFGGGCPFALAHDYRIMNSKRGFFCMPPVELGVSFPGIGLLPRLKLTPQTARKMLLEAHRWTGEEALKDGIVDEIAESNELLERALVIAQKWKVKAKMGVYGVLRNELWGDAGKAFRDISYVHHRPTAVSKPKI